MTQPWKGSIEAALIAGTTLSIAGVYMFAALTAAGRKPVFWLQPKWYLPPLDYVFFPSRLTAGGLRARKRCFLSAAAELFFILCDILVLWTRPI